jgi:hypothetical protein
MGVCGYENDDPRRTVSNYHNKSSSKLWGRNKLTGIGCTFARLAWRAVQHSNHQQDQTPPQQTGELTLQENRTCTRQGH